MKRIKKAFTLAEVLITIGLLGVIATITLPSLSNNVSATQLAAALKTTQATISDKLDAGMALEDAQTVRDLKAFATPNDLTSIYKGLSKYLRLDPVDGAHTVYSMKDGSKVKEWPQASIRQLNTKAFIYLEDYANEETTDGALLIKQKGGNVIRKSAKVFIDVNGYVKPNRFGYDVYEYYLAQDGRLYPVGGADVSLFKTAGESETTAAWDSSNTDYNCDWNSVGYGCAGRIEDEGWKITYLGKRKSSTKSEEEKKD